MRIRTVFGIAQPEWPDDLRRTVDELLATQESLSWRKGIVLAGGAGTRLHPCTLAVSKQLLPVYNKPLVCYSLSTLMLAGIRDVLVITTPEDQNAFRRLLGDGAELGMHITYAVQPTPGGLAQAFLIGRDFVGTDPCALVLGDNLFFGNTLSHQLAQATARKAGATVFCHRVRDPERYGVLRTDADGRPVEILEKPASPPSHWAVTGIYFYDNRVLDIAASLTPSARGELEISDVNNVYLRDGSLNVEYLGRGMTWLDTGTFDSLLDAALFVETMEKRQGQRIGCLEEISFRMGFIDHDAFAGLIERTREKSLHDYLQGVLGRGARSTLVDRI